MCNVKYFICPMSKEIIDSVIEMNDDRLGLIPSRRQVDYNSGYVMETKSFFDYVRKKSNILIERDHAGVGQGNVEFDEYISYEKDSFYMDIIHVDPWKKYPILDEGIFETVRNIEFLNYHNFELLYEIGTEQSIRPFTAKELDYLINKIKNKLNETNFSKIEYVCIQSGVGLDIINKKNIGVFDLDRMKEMISIVNEYGKKTKEHNGDYLTEEEYKIRFENGLDSINIGPEIVQIQTSIYLDIMTKTEIDDFYEICFKSNKWQKWVDDDFDISNKENLIMICGHYNYNSLNKNFMNLSAFDNMDEIIKEKIKSKLKELLSYV